MHMSKSAKCEFCGSTGFDQARLKSHAEMLADHMIPEDKMETTIILGVEIPNTAIISVTNKTIGAAIIALGEIKEENELNIKGVKAKRKATILRLVDKYMPEIKTVEKKSNPVLEKKGDEMEKKMDESVKAVLDGVGYRYDLWWSLEVQAGMEYSIIQEGKGLPTLRRLRWSSEIWKVNPKHAKGRLQGLMLHMNGMVIPFKNKEGKARPFRVSAHVADSGLIFSYKLLAVGK